MLYYSLISSSLFRTIVLLGTRLPSIVNAVPRSIVNLRSQSSYTPVAFAVGTTPIIDGLQTYSSNTVILNSSTPVLTLDYGAEVAGFPYFEVTSIEGSVAQIELKYSEQFQGLNLEYGDGPW